MALLHYEINMPSELEEDNLFLYMAGGQDHAFFTTKGHVEVDTIVQRYLEDLQCKDQETKKTESIWGIPDIIPSSYTKAWVLRTYPPPTLVVR